MPEVYIIPDPLQMVLQLIVTLIMFLVVRRFFWKPVTKFIEAKREISVAEINEAKARNHEAQVFLDEAKQTVAEAREEANDIVSASKVSANTVHESIIKEARKEAEYLKSNARENIELEKAKFYDELKDDLVDLAVSAAEKIVEDEIDESKHVKIVDSVIDGAL